MSKAIRTVFEVAVAVAAAVVTGNPLVGLAVFGAEEAIDVAVFGMKMPTGAGNFGAAALSFQGDPTAPIPYAMGRTGFAGRIIKQGSSGLKPKSGSEPEKPNYYLHYVNALSFGPIKSIASFKVNNTIPVTFDANGAAATTPYAGFMWQRRQLGAAPYTAMTQPPGSLAYGGAWAGWTADHKLSSMAADWWILAAENPPFESGTPPRIAVLEGVYCYDPRLDSTRTDIGGSGPCRVDDETTWPWTENPYLHGLTFALGRYRNDKRMIGVGVPLSAIDVSAYVQGANICDANGWKVGGMVYSSDSKWKVLQDILAAGGGKPLQLRASLSCSVTAPRVSIATITAADLAGVPQITKTRTRRDRVNILIPSYRSEDHGWQIVAASPIRVDAYVTADKGEERQREETWQLVQAAAGQAPNQVAQLARYFIENSREPGPFVLPLKPYLLGLKPGDCVTLDDPAFRLSSQKAVATSRTIDTARGAANLTFTGETDAKHVNALAQTGVAPPIPEDS